VCVVGSFMMDLVLRAPRRPRSGETVLGTSFGMYLGGKGFNQAIAAVRAGSRTAIVGRVGRDDFGDRFLECLRREGVDAGFVVADPDEGTGVGVPLVDDEGENSIVAVPRANFRVGADDVEAAGDLILSSDVLLVQLELPVDAVVTATRIARDAGVMVVLNPAPAVAAAESFTGLVDLVVANRAETALLTDGADDADPRVAAHRLRDAVGTDVIVTLGTEGGVVVDGEGEEDLRAYDVPVVDTVGAGDAFCGTLAAALAAGVPLRAAAHRASAAGGLAVTRSGAEPSMPTAAAVDDLIATGRLRAALPRD
jgi:ribokinase